MNKSGKKNSRTTMIGDPAQKGQFWPLARTSPCSRDLSPACRTRDHIRISLSATPGEGASRRWTSLGIWGFGKIQLPWPGIAQDEGGRGQSATPFSETLKIGFDSGSEIFPREPFESELMGRIQEGRERASSPLLDPEGSTFEIIQLRHGQKAGMVPGGPPLVDHSGPPALFLENGAEDPGKILPGKKG